MTPLLALPLLFQAAQTYTIDGTLVNSVTGAPIAKARVTLSPARAQEAITWTDGRFRFTGLPAGKYALQAERLGYATQRYGQRALYERFSSAVITGGNEATDNLTFRMIPSAVISGYVTDSRGEPLPGMTVQALQIVGAGKWRRVVRSPSGSTDDRGYYRLSSLMAGVFAVVVAGRPFQSLEIASVDPVAYAPTFYPGVTNPDQASFLTVKAGQEARADVVVRSVAEGRIVGEAPQTDPNKKIYAALMAPTLFHNLIPVTASAGVFGGHFTFEHVPAGRYTLDLVEESSRVVSMTEVNVEPGDNKVTAGVASLPQVTVAVSMSGKPRYPSSTLLVQLQAVEGRSSPTAPVTSGKGVIPQIMPGRYALTVLQGRELAITSMAVRGASVAGELVDIPDTGRVEIDVAVDAAAQDLHGRLVREGKPQPGVLVMLVQRDGWKYTASFRFDQTDSDGTFTWPSVPQGDYLMFALEAGLPYDYDDPDTIRKLLPIAQPLHVSGDAGQTVQLSLLPLPAEK